jgi:hypothetical protein
LQRDRLGSAAFVALLLASLAPDLLDLVYAVAGVCNPYGLFSHTVHAVVLQAAVIGGATLLITGSRAAALTFASVVLLHVAGDYFTGQKLLMPGGDFVGLRWYDKPLLDFALELPILIGGWWILRRSGRAPRWAISVRALALLVLLQSVFDVYAAFHTKGIKPTACIERISLLSRTSAGSTRYAVHSLPPRVTRN